MGSLSILRVAGMCLVIGFVVLFLQSIQTVSLESSAASTSFTGVAEWHIETVDTATRGNSSIAVDSSGYPRISYESDGSVQNPYQNLSYARWTGEQWITETIDSMFFGSADTSLALDSSGNPHISYAECIAWGCIARYAEWTGGSWLVTEHMDGHGSLVVDNSGNPHISYGHGNLVGMTSLRYAYREAGVWMTRTVDVDPISNKNTSLALDESGYPHISYYRGDALMYAYWSGSEWITQAVDSAYMGTFGQHTSLVLDASDDPHIVYYDGDRQDLRYAERVGTGWVSQTVDSTGDVGKYASLALDSYGFPHISYYDADNRAVKYAYWTGIGWQTKTVDVGVGEDVTSLAVGVDNRLHLGYYYYGGSTDRALRYAYGDVISYTHSVNLPLVSVNNQ